MVNRIVVWRAHQHHEWMNGCIFSIHPAKQAVSQPASQDYYMGAQVIYSNYSRSRESPQLHSTLYTIRKENLAGPRGKTILLEYIIIMGGGGRGRVNWMDVWRNE